MKETNNVEHLIKITAHFICEECGDTTSINIPLQGKSKRSYCCSARYEAFWDGDETVVRRIKQKEEKERNAKIRRT